MARTDKGMGIESVCVWRSGPIVSSSQRWEKGEKIERGSLHHQHFSGCLGYH